MLLDKDGCTCFYLPSHAALPPPPPSLVKEPLGELLVENGVFTSEASGTLFRIGGLLKQQS